MFTKVYKMSFRMAAIVSTQQQQQHNSDIRGDFANINSVSGQNNNDDNLNSNLRYDRKMLLVSLVNGDIPPSFRSKFEPLTTSVGVGLHLLSSIKKESSEDEEDEDVTSAEATARNNNGLGQQQHQYNVGGGHYYGGGDPKALFRRESYRRILKDLQGNMISGTE